jgi:hypothetical protein
MLELYRGCWVGPCVSELTDGSGWIAEVSVAHNVGVETVDTQWILKGKFPTREAAHEAALAAGKRKVDELRKDEEIQLK